MRWVLAIAMLICNVCAGGISMGLLAEIHTAGEAAGWTDISTNNLISLWAFEGNALDSFGTNDATVTGAVLTNGVSGVASNAYMFNGNDDMDINDTPFRFNSGAQDFSVMCWFKSSLQSSQMLIDKRNADNNGWRLIYVGGSRIIFSVDTLDANGTIDVADGTWHHIAATCDRSGNAQVYIDGVVDGSPTAISGEAMNTTVNLTFGKASFSDITYMNGGMGPPRIYGRLVTSNEVYNMWQQFTP